MAREGKPGARELEIAPHAGAVSRVLLAEAERQLSLFRADLEVRRDESSR